MNDALSPMEAVMWRVGQDPGLRMTTGNLLFLEQALRPSELIERLGAASETAFRLRQRPSEATYVRRRPHWESERDFDPARHVRVLTVAPPGDRRQVLDLVARLEPIPFDPGRSPWDATLIEGLADNKAGVFLRASAHSSRGTRPGGTAQRGWRHTNTSFVVDGRLLTGGRAGPRVDAGKEA